MINPDQEFLYFPDTQVNNTPTSLHYVIIKSHFMVTQQEGGSALWSEWLQTTDDSLADS